METKSIAEAILLVMKDVEGVAKSMTVGSGSNSYKGVSDKDVRIVMRESMIKNGLSILPIAVNPTVKVDRWEEESQYGNKSKQSIFTEVTTKYLLLHTSGESLEIAGYGHGVDTQDKGAGKATTYALKNALLNMFLVPTGVDTDDTHSDDLEVPKKTYAKKGKELIEYIDEIKSETDTNAIVVIAKEALELFKSEKQQEWIKREARQRTDLLNSNSRGPIPHQSFDE